MRAAVSLMVLALLLPISAKAGSPAKEDCGAMSNQPDMNACFGRALDRANARLNAAYAKAIKDDADDAKGVELLRAAERAWLDFRDRSCAYQAHDDEGGSIYPTTLATCEITMTDARTKELQAPN